ncbi:MAG TPA: zinc metallopeptidase [Anaerolineaceae bacterium]|nr:zinc metallopeptidase [Anaerolineaceae bacterium]
MNLSYLIFMIPGLLLSLWAQAKVKSAYSKWGQVRNSNNVTGLDTAIHLKPRVGLENVTLTSVQGELTDHYDPRKDTLALSQGVANTPSVAAMAITAHELGHALQDKESYGPMRLRSAIVPLVGLGSNLGIILVMAGLALQMMTLFNIGIILFSSTTIFSLITVPVELDASKRARVMLAEQGLVRTDEEKRGVDQVLTAAAWTYVAGLVTSLLQLFYYMSMAGRASGRRRY